MIHKWRISVLHGPNLNLLGYREPALYGRASLDELNATIVGHGDKVGAQVDTWQSNSEGDIITCLQQAVGTYDGVVINPGAYAHTSVAIRDAIAAVGIPVIEVHLTNLYRREKFRRKLVTAGVCIGVICGLGVHGYTLALDGLLTHLKNRRG